MSEFLEIARSLPLQWEWVGAWCGFLIFWLIIWILVGVWVYQDAESRGTSGILWFIIVFFLGLIGLLIYLVVRPSGPRPMYAPAPGYGYAPPQYPQQYQQPYVQPAPPAYPAQTPAQPVPQPAVQPAPQPAYTPPAQPATPTCPRCGRPVQWVAQYQRWFCPTENLYPWG